MTPANTPQSLPAPLAALRQRYKSLQSARKAAKENLPHLIQTGNTHAVLALRDTLRAALKSFKEELVRDPVQLTDGRSILRHEHEGLRIFAQRNGLSIDYALGRVTITNNSVTAADFNKLNITTLEGLKFLQGLEALEICQNKGLTSLEGIPSQVKVLYAWQCGLTGDLKALTTLTRLMVLYIYCNAGLTSLEGIPSQVEVLYAWGCGLEGDLKALATLGRLKALNISLNSGLASLNGIPSQVEVLHASYCGLTEDLQVLASLTRLRTLDVRNNESLNHKAVRATIKKLKSLGVLKEVSI